MSLVGLNKQDLDRLLATQETNNNIFNESDTYVIDERFYKYVPSSNDLVQIEPDAPFLLRYNPATQLYVADENRLTPPLGNFNNYLGWALYGDTEYTDLVPWQPAIGVWSDVPNNSGIKVNNELPRDAFEDFYKPDTKKIDVFQFDSLTITVQMVLRPTKNQEMFAEVAFNVGGTVGPLQDGRLYGHLLYVPKGVNEPRVHSFSVDAIVDDDWFLNGAGVEIKPSETMDVYEIAFLIQRLYKERTPLLG